MKHKAISKHSVLAPTGKRARRISLFMGLLFYVLPPLSGQDMQDTIIAHFKLIESLPHEKLYLHLDKPFYGAGEKIWFKGYLVNAVDHQDNSQSNFIITELVNRSDSILERKKIRRDSLGFHNAFTLPPALPEGDYYLRGYSNWMLNGEPDFFYSRNLKIGNSIDNAILSSITYRRQPDDNTRYTADISFFNNSKEPYRETKIRYRYIENGKQRDKGKRETDVDGRISIPLPDMSSTVSRRIEVEFDDPKYIYKKTFHLPAFSKEFDISFFPEGGTALAIPQQNIAFKAQGADGYSKEVTGILCNAKGDTLGHFSSEHDGMGMFTLYSNRLDSCYAVVTSSDSVTKTFPLPRIEPKGVSLAMTHHRDNIRFHIQKTEATEWPEKLFLVAHTRGKLMVLQPIRPGNPAGIMKDSVFQEGITHFLVIDGQGNTLSERLIFVPDRKPTQWTLRTDKPSYGKREKVSLQIAAKNHDGTPLSGNFSVSITDRSKIQPDSLADHICSNLLLTSDLKGYIENPGFYFLKQDIRTLHLLDLVMLTHGWRRHKLTKLSVPPSLDFPNYIEHGQTISGRIKGFFGKDVKKGPIYALAPQANIFASTVTDDEGRFTLDVAFKDSTVFAVQARTKRGFAGVDIEIDEPPYPKASPKSPFSDVTPPFMEDYLRNTRDKYYTEGGIRVYNLKEVLVTARRKGAGTKSVYTGGINTYTIEGEELTKFGAQTAYDVALRLPGVTPMKGSEIHIRNNPERAAIVIDDVIYEDDDYILKNIMADNMASISVLRGTDALILGPRAAAGAIVITLIDPEDIPLKPAQGIITCSPLGYSESVEFYHPTYDTQEERNSTRPDLRSTTYWNPSLSLDNEGKACIEYYMPDSDSPQDIVIEGIGKNGKVCRFRQTINLQ